MDKKTNYGIVFGGGGAKGAYEIGVWKALNELNIPIDTVVGTSVGALNGAMMVQGDYELACTMWNELTMSGIVNFGLEVDLSKKTNLSLASIMKSVKHLVISGGMDVSPLKALAYKVVDEKKIRESKMDFGIVTFSLTDFKPVNLFIKDIPEGMLIEYLLASSCFPTFQPQIIDNKRYIDGGIYDNIPVSLLIGKCTHIITVDVSGPGRKRRVDTSDHEIICIKNSQYLGRTLQFDGENSKVNIEFGYFDTLRAFGKTVGKIYYINNPAISEKYINYFSKREIESIYRFYGVSINDNTSKLIDNVKFRLLRKIRQHSIGKLDEHNIFIAMTEICSECLGINRRKLYNLDELLEEIMKEYEKYNKALVEKSTNVSVSSKLTNLSKSLVFYKPNIDEMNQSIISKRRLMALSEPKSAIANLFFSMLLKEWKKE